MPHLWRAYHPGATPAPGAAVELEAGEAHYVRRVLRLGAGERLTLFDGRGREWLARLASGPGRSARVEVEDELETRVECAFEVVLFAGSRRADKLEWLIQKTTEVGVAAIRPVVGDARDGEPRALAARVTRWRRIGLEAARQCGRRVIPAIEPVHALPAEVPAATLALLLDPRAGVAEIGAALGRPAPPRAWLAVGPESGFTPEEVGAAHAAGFGSVGLGPRILRAETAAVVATALLVHRWGDLGSAPV